MGEDVREIIVVDTWIAIGEGLALAEADGVVVASDVTRMVETCISAERVSNTAVIRIKGLYTYHHICYTAVDGSVANCADIG
jgi:hypothetical protein